MEWKKWNGSALLSKKRKKNKKEVKELRVYISFYMEINLQRPYKREAKDGFDFGNKRDKNRDR